MRPEPSNDLQPITCTIDKACQISGLSRATIYRLLARQELQAAKIGGRTLVFVDSLRQRLEQGRGHAA